MAQGVTIDYGHLRVSETVNCHVSEKLLRTVLGGLVVVSCGHGRGVVARADS